MLPHVPKLRPNTDAENIKYRLSMAETSRLEIPVNDGLSYLPYQIAGVEYACRNEYATFFADPMGLGKTIQAIGFMNSMSILKAVVICPSSVTFKWKRELEKWHVGKPKVSIFHPATFTGHEEIIILPYYWTTQLEAVALILNRFKFEYLVIDECHFLKSPEARRTKHVLARNGLRSKARYVHALSGTPLVNRPVEMYPIIKALCPQSIENMNAFEYGLYFCGGHQIKIKGRQVWQFNGATNLKILGLKLRSHFMVRRAKANVLTQLPEKFPPNIVYLNPQGSVTKFDLLDEDLVIKGARGANFDEISTIRREIGEAKAQPAAEYIREQLEAGHEKIVVFVHHSTVAQTIEKRLHDYGYETAIIVGSTHATRRQTNVDRFQNDPNVRVFIGSIGAAGTGIDLIASSYVIIVEPSWVPGENEQAIDRCHRIGQTKGVQTDYLVFDNTLDLRVLKYLVEKTKNINEVLNVTH